MGTESTCATALEITLILKPALLTRVTAVVQSDELPGAAEHVGEIVQWTPIGLEAIDDEPFRDEKPEHMDAKGPQKLPRPGRGAWLLVQFGADAAEEVRDVSSKALPGIAHAQEGLCGGQGGPVRPNSTRRVCAGMPCTPPNC